MIFSQDDLQQETIKLFQKLEKSGWTLDECASIADKTLEIKQLKKEQNATILAHSYQSPEIMYAVADFIGDSYSLSKIASQLNTDKIIFASVYFMGETAKLLNPDKEVLVPAVAGCSLADSITAQKVRELRQEFPDYAFVCYINTTAEVKAECDVCVTSSNALKIVEKLDNQKIYFLPDKLMAQNLQQQTKKEIKYWSGTCIVHEFFSPTEIDLLKKQYPKVKILAHLECESEVVQKADLAGSTKQMLDYVAKSSDESFMLVTECGITDRVRTENLNKKILGSCNLCPFMRSITLDGILKALKNPSQKQRVELNSTVFEKAKRSLDKMFELAEK